MLVPFSSVEHSRRPIRYLFGDLEGLASMVPEEVAIVRATKPEIRIAKLLKSKEFPCQRSI